MAPSEARLTELDKRVQSIETYFKIMIGVAAILGVSGAVLLTGIRSAQADITTIRNDLPGIKQSADGLKETTAAAIATVNSAVDKRISEVAKLPTGIMVFWLSTAANAKLPEGWKACDSKFNTYIPEMVTNPNAVGPVPQAEVNYFPAQGHANLSMYKLMCLERQ
jgi:hypothetical protein